jgi:AbiV family abortive infection protein
MRARAIRDLVQLPDKYFFSEVSAGLEHVFHNAARIERDAILLAEQKRSRGSRILMGIAEEEMAKFLILLDAVRCPRVPPESFSQQLSRFNDHLAKGIYAEACNWRPGSLGQLAEYVDDSRQQYYLDGPTGADWIFRNRIIEQRERTIYVDYVDTDEGHCWTPPYAGDEDIILVYSPAVISLHKH